MADNITLDPGTGGAVVKTDDDGTAHWQYVKLAYGADNTQTRVTTSAPLPVDLRTDNLSGNLDINIAASAATVTVSGTVTANAGTGTMTVTDDGSFTLAANSGVDIGDVDVLSIVPGTGATNLGKAVDSASAATDTGIAVLLVRDDTLTTLTPIDGDYVRGRTNNRGAQWVEHDGTVTVTDDGSFTLAANTGVDIGDVDVTSVVPGTGATNLGKAEDAAHTTGDVGVMALAIRRDVDSSSVGADGDYAPLQLDATGYLKVIIHDGGESHTVDGTVTANAGTNLNTSALALESGGNLATLAGAVSGSEMQVDIVASPTLTVTDDGAFTLAANSGVDIGDVDVLSVIAGTGPTNLGKAVDAASGATDTGVASLFVRDDTLGTLTPIDGDYVRGRTNNRGALWVEHDGTVTVTDDGSFTLAANSGVDIGDVDVLSVVPGTGATNLGKAEDAAHTTGDTGVMALGVRRDANTTLVGTDGDYAPFQLDANGALKVEIFDGGDSHTIDGTVTASNTAGDVAHDSADSGNPVKVGAVARTAHPTAVGAGDRVNVYADDLGRLVTQPYGPRDRLVKDYISLTDSTETTLVAAGGVGVFNDLLMLIVSNESATEQRVDFRDSTAGSVVLSVDLAADGGGAVINFTAPFPQAAANNNWTADVVPGGATVYVTSLAVENS